MKTILPTDSVPQVLEKVMARETQPTEIFTIDAESPAERLPEVEKAVQALRNRVATASLANLH